MTCKDLTPLLASLGDGSLPLVDEKLARAHLEGCPTCRAALDRLEKLELLLGAGFAIPDPGEAYFHAQKERLLRAGVVGSISPSPVELRRPRRARFAWAAAAAILILAAGAGYWRGVPARAPDAGSTSELSVRAEKPSLPVASARTEPSTPRPEERSPGVLIPVPSAQTSTLPESAPVRSTTPGPEPALVLPAPRALLQAPNGAPLAQDSGAAERLAAMTEEAVAIGLAETPRERVVALFGAAEARLGELSKVLRQDPLLASELAGAYLLLLGEGVRSVLADGTESSQDLALARLTAREHARGHESKLLELGALAQGKLKGSLEEALAVSRELARP